MSLSPHTSAQSRESAATQLPRRLVYALCFAIVCGLYFRFTRLDDKFFWLDETHSAAVAAGNAPHEIEALFDGHPRSLVDMQRYLRVQPARPISDLIDSLRELPENAPLYFISLRYWSAACGDSPAALRAFSAWLAIVGAGLLLLLCRELNFSRAAATCTLCWWSLSPLLVLYSQEARTYSLFSVWILSVNLMLLRAVRLQNWTNWLGYILAAAAGVYTHMFLGLLLAAHSVFVAALGMALSSTAERRRLFARFACAGACIGIAFSPWVLVVLNYKDRAFLTNFLNYRIELYFQLQSWAEGLAAAFVDFGLHGSTPTRAANVAISIAVIAAVFWSAWFVRRFAPSRTALFLLTTGGIPPLILIGYDVVFGGIRSEVIRFWLPGLISIGMMFGYAMGTQIAAGSRSAAITAFVMLAAAVGSCLRSAAEPTWWNKIGIVSRLDSCLSDHQVRLDRLAEIAATPGALLVIDKDRFAAFDLLALSTLADPRVEWLGVADPERFEPPADRTIYLFHSHRSAKRLQDRDWGISGKEPTWPVHVVRPNAAK